MLDGMFVCSDEWDALDGAVLCRELGYPYLVYSKEIEVNSSVSTGFSDFLCSGDEFSLSSCPHLDSNQTCGQKIAAVQCSQTARGEIRILMINYCLFFPIDYRVTLVGGNTTAEGGVYVDDGPVCDYSWGWRDALVVCKSLGFSFFHNVFGNSYFGMVPDNFINGVGYVNCNGDEESLRNCTFSETVKCPSGHGAGVSCTNEAPGQYII